MKFALTMTLGLAGAVAHASFDLLLIHDQNARKVHRYDAASNVYLGAVNLPGTTSGLVVDQSTGTFLTLASGSLGIALQRYSIWTGQFVSSLVMPSYEGGAAQISAGASGELLRTTLSGVQRINASTGVLQGFIAWGTPDFEYSNSRAAVLANGELATAADSDGSPFGTDRVMLFNQANVWQASSTLPLPSGDTIMADLVAQGNNMLNVYYNTNTTAYTLDLLRRGPTSLSRTTLTSSTSHLTFGVEWGHGTDAYQIERVSNTSEFSFRKVDTLVGWVGSRNLMPQVTNITDTAIFLAPEPGTMIALGAGVVLILRRRKAH